MIMMQQITGRFHHRAPTDASCNLSKYGHLGAGSSRITAAISLYIRPLPALFISIFERRSIFEDVASWPSLPKEESKNPEGFLDRGPGETEFKVVGNPLSLRRSDGIVVVSYCRQKKCIFGTLGRPLSYGPACNDQVVNMHQKRISRLGSLL